MFSETTARVVGSSLARTPRILDEKEEGVKHLAVRRENRHLSDMQDYGSGTGKTKVLLTAGRGKE